MWENIDVGPVILANKALTIFSVQKIYKDRKFESIFEFFNKKILVNALNWPWKIWDNIWKEKREKLLYVVYLLQLFIFRLIRFK